MLTKPLQTLRFKKMKKTYIKTSIISSIVIILTTVFIQWDVDIIPDFSKWNSTDRAILLIVLSTKIALDYIISSSIIDSRL